MLTNPLEGYVDIHVQPAPEQLPKTANPNAKLLWPDYTVSYRTANFVYEEGLFEGRFVSLSYNASGYMMAANYIPAPSYMDIRRFPQPESFRIEVDGQSLCSHWEWGGFEKTETPKGLLGTVTLIHKIRPVTVRIHTLLDGTPVMQRWIDVVNTSDKPAALSAFAPISGPMQITRGYASRLQPGDSLYKLGAMSLCSWGHEGSFEWVDLPDAIYTVAGRFRRNRHRHPMFVLANRATGEHFICQLAWSSGYAFEFDLCEDTSDDACLSFKVALDSPAPLRMIDPGETWAGPAVHLGAVFGGLDAAVNAMHKHVRKTVFWPNAMGRSSAWVQSGIGPEYDMSRESTLNAIDYAASIGVELFFIDAGWYTPPKNEDLWWTLCGDWNYNTERYPNGLSEIVDYAHSKGLKFGLWMDADRIGPSSKVYKEHPDWVGTRYNGSPAVSGSLNLADPKVADWMESQIAHVIGDYHLDFFRLDWNVSYEDLHQYNLRDGYLENTFARYNENLYRVYGNLRKRFPDVIFENCAGGGGRTDLGLIDKFSHTWVTDWQIAPRSFLITNGMTIALPPERINRLMGGQTAYLTADLRFQVRNQMFTQANWGGICPPFARQNEEQLNVMRHHIGIFKDFVRPMFDHSCIYHHTPVLDREPHGFGVLELATEEGDRSMIGVFQLSDPQQPVTTVYPRGIKASGSYKVTFDNTGAASTVSGYDLVHNGIRVELEGALTSELILIEAE